MTCIHYYCTCQAAKLQAATPRPSLTSSLASLARLGEVGLLALASLAELENYGLWPYQRCGHVTNDVVIFIINCCSRQRLGGFP